MLQGFSHTCHLFYVIMIQFDNRKEAKKMTSKQKVKKAIQLLEEVLTEGDIEEYGISESVVEEAHDMLEQEVEYSE